jgi:hypothetical protein
MRTYKINNRIYLSVSEIININSSEKNWEWLKEEYENKRKQGSWIVEDQIELGNVIHKFVDKCIQKKIRKPDWLNVDLENCLLAKSEFKIFHKDLLYAGTMDMIVINKDHTQIIDLKTVTYTDIIDNDGRLFNIKIRNKISKTAIQLAAYKHAYLSHQPEKKVVCRCIVYDPYNGNLVKDHIYNDKKMDAGLKKFMDLYNICEITGLLESLQIEDQ